MEVVYRESEAVKALAPFAVTVTVTVLAATLGKILLDGRKTCQASSVKNSDTAAHAEAGAPGHTHRDRIPANDCHYLCTPLG